MTDPIVLCICLTRDRPEMATRAVHCFNYQSYERRYLMILDTGQERDLSWKATEKISRVHLPKLAGRHIGDLRNIAVDQFMAQSGITPYLIAHIDDDDWSDPGRLMQQVYFQKLTERPVVGYYDMTFYETQNKRVLWYDSKLRNYVLGTSLLYRREIWDKHRFPDCTPEDTTWQHSIGPENIAAISSVRNGRPMMIQTLHGANAAAHYSNAAFE